MKCTNLKRKLDKILCMYTFMSLPPRLLPEFLIALCSLQHTCGNPNSPRNQGTCTCRAGPSVTGPVPRHTAPSSLFPALDSLVKSCSKLKGIMLFNLSHINLAEYWVSLKWAFCAIASPGARCQLPLDACFWGVLRGLLLAMPAALYKSIFRSQDICHDTNYSDAMFSLKEL